jgi:uncharacterized peroxidase-related enzyme
MGTHTPMFLTEPAPAPAAQTLYDEDEAELGYVMSASRLWAYQPETFEALFDLMDTALRAFPLSRRQRGVLVTACASTLGDSYCSLAWGTRLAEDADASTAAGVLRGDDTALTDQERAMAAWTRAVVRDPNSTTLADIERLHDAGLTDEHIFAITTYVALRVAFSTINDALGACPDEQLAAGAPVAVREAVDYGRRPSSK